MEADVAGIDFSSVHVIQTIQLTYVYIHTHIMHKNQAQTSESEEWQLLNGTWSVCFNTK